MKVRNSVHRSEDEVSIIDEDSEAGEAAMGHDLEAADNEVVFNESTSKNGGRSRTTETSVSIDVPPPPASRNRGRRQSRSLQPHTTTLSSTGSLTGSISSFPYSLPQSYFNS